MISVRFCAKLVGVAGFEPATPSSRTRLTYLKTLKNIAGSPCNFHERKGNRMNNCAETVPAILTMKPKQAKAEFVKWMQAQTFSPEVGRLAEFVLLSINELILNEGKAVEEVSRDNLRRRLA